MTAAARLEANSIPEPNSGCRLWLGARNAGGYGNIIVEGQTRAVHRVAYEEAFGPIPDGMLVCHRCDIRSCCEPSHLFLGRHRDNSADMVAKDRQSRGPRREMQGEKHPRAKLTPEQVAAIVRDGRFQREIAADYGISQTHVSAIKNRQTWSHMREAT